MGDGGGRLPRRWVDVVLDVLAVAGVVAVLVFPAAAVASVSSPPKIADPATTLAPLHRSPVGDGRRDVPVFASARDDVEAEISAGGLPAALADHSQAVFGASGGPELLALASNGDATLPLTEYPLHDPRVDQLLDRTPDVGAMPAAKVAAVNDLAGLLVLAAVNDGFEFPNAAPVAYALYDRARQSDACDPQLNLAFLVSANLAPLRDATVAEFERATRDCPGDPTPRWLLGQWESVRLPTGDAALETFRQLERRFPGSALGWSGEADTLVRDAYRVDVPQPFTAQADFRRAEALYRRAELLDPREPGLLAGEARARGGQ